MNGPPIKAAKAAAQSFVQRLPDGTSVAVVGFSAVPVVASELSTDKAAVGAAIEGLSATGETALYDAVLAGAGLFLPGHAIVGPWSC